MRHTTFRFALEPTVSQRQALMRHAGASRFAYTQCLRLLAKAIADGKTDSSANIPWSRFDLINTFNAWKRSEDAGRILVVAVDGTITKQVTGLAWRHEVSAPVFEEAAVDLARALAAFAGANSGERPPRRIGFPKPKRKGRCRDSFRLRNKIGRNGTCSIRVGDGHPRSVTLPTIGVIRVHEDTRPVRRLLRPVQQVDSGLGKPTPAPRAKVLFATVVRHADRWYVCLTVLAPDLHPDRRHHSRGDRTRKGFVGVDRGLRQFAVAATADGTEVGRWPAPRPLTRRLEQVRRHSKALSRKKLGSSSRAKAARRLSREHARITNVRRTFLHQVSCQLAQTHSKLAIEDLRVANLLANRRLARALGDVGWGIFARQLTYKVGWLGGELVICDRWFPSTRTCRVCGTIKRHLKVEERTFRCRRCDNSCDRDRNAAANLAAWAERSGAPDRQAAGRVNNVPGGNGAGHRLTDGGSGPDEGETDAPAVAEAPGHPRRMASVTSAVPDVLYP